jgi:hypothetical protein
MEIHSNEEICIVHYKDGKRVAVTFFNGHEERFVIHGNLKVTKRKPRDINRDYKIMRPYFFKWREKIGKIECDCTEVLEAYMPYYGCTWYHSDDCALIKQMEAKPHLWNLWCYQHLPGFPASFGYADHVAFVGL